jgi:hypothetical protein
MPSKKPERKQIASLATLILDPENGDDIPPKRRLTFNGLYGVISQKIALFKKNFV